MWDFLVWLYQWPFLNITNYATGAVIVWASILIISTICEAEKISLFTPIALIANIFHKEYGSAAFFLGAGWGPVIWFLTLVCLPFWGIYELCNYANNKVKGEMGIRNRSRMWLESKVLFDFNKKDEIR